MPEPSSAHESSPATDFSVALLCALVKRGLRHVVLSPGSRSQSLALVAAELERVGAIELHVRIDERVAGFLALGLAVETGVPAAVVTTSGTATANLLPAVLEAHHSGVPMIVITADRPAELRGVRANQTTQQPGIYGAAARLAVDVDAPTGAVGETDAAARLADDAWRAAVGAAVGGGPVQLNVAFREPLSTPVPELSRMRQFAPNAPAEVAHSAQTGAHETRAPSVEESQESQVSQRPTLTLGSGPRTIVIAGHGAGEHAEAVARAGGWPLIAEVSSGARFGPNLVVRYRELLADDEFGGQVERAVVFGHPTLSREVPALLRRDDIESIVVTPAAGEFYNPGHTAVPAAAVRIEGAEPASQAARAWVGRWVFTSRRLMDESAAHDADSVAPDVEAGRSHDSADRLAFARGELAAIRAPITRRMLVDALWRFTWPHDRLVFGASRLIRDADRAVPGKKVHVHANRGLAGIDGTVATGIGIALGLDASSASAAGTTRVLLGDLALLHDVGALLFGDGETRPRIQVIVGNDGGGTIFDALEVAYTAPPAAFDRVLFTPQRVDVAALAAAYGWNYSRATTHGELDQALSAPADGPSIIEVPLDR